MDNKKNNDMTTLLLVRHGETVDNVRQIMQGQTQGKLTPNGIEQARALAAELKDTPIDVFVSSELKRALRYDSNNNSDKHCIETSERIVKHTSPSTMNVSVHPPTAKRFRYIDNAKQYECKEC